MIRVYRKILKKENNHRILDKYTIFNNCLFRKSIKYLFIGLNPSANNSEFTDATNLWIINWIIKNDVSGGYFLTNLYKDISSTANKSTKIPNDMLNKVLLKYKDLKICVFYGKQVVTDKEVNLDDTCRKILQFAFDENRLFMTAQNGEFHHISMSSNGLDVVNVDDLRRIGLN